VTLVYDTGRLWVDVTAEIPIACYPAGQEPDPDRMAGVDLGIIHPHAVAGTDGQGLLVSGRAIRAARLGGGTTPTIPAGVTHRRAGAHLPGVAPSRRDPRRRAHHRGARGSPGRHRPAPPPS
jgi:hypothetical protein